MAVYDWLNKSNKKGLSTANCKMPIENDNSRFLKKAELLEGILFRNLNEKGEVVKKPMMEGVLRLTLVQSKNCVNYAYC